MTNFASSPPPPLLAATFTVVAYCNPDFATTYVVPLNLTSISNLVSMEFDREMVEQQKILSFSLEV